MLQIFGILNLVAFRIGQEGLYPYINSNDFIGFKKPLFRHIIARETNIPLISGIPAYSDCLNIPFNLARQSQLESAYIPDRQIFTIKFPSCLFEREAVIPVPAFESW